MRSLYLLKGGDGAPRGCAMVLYSRWAHAEAAVAALDGVDAFARGRGLVVHFANPRRPAPGAPAELGIAPRKLFVGRLPRDADEAELRPLFEAHGPVESLAVLRTARGASAGCAFVRYATWAAAEAAIDALAGRVALPGADAPLVLKFADARRRDGITVGGGVPGLPPALASGGAGWGLYPGAEPWAPLERALDGAGSAHSSPYDPGAGTYGGGAGAPLDPMGGDGGLSLPDDLHGDDEPRPPTLKPAFHHAAPGVFAVAAADAPFGAAPPVRRPGAPPPFPDALLPDVAALALGRDPHAVHPMAAAAPPIWGQQRFGPAERCAAWKLFVGQLPPDAAEGDLLPVFAPVGTVLELYVLRNSVRGGEERGAGVWRARAAAWPPQPRPPSPFSPP